MGAQQCKTGALVRECYLVPAVRRVTAGARCRASVLLFGLLLLFGLGVVVRRRNGACGYPPRDTGNYHSPSDSSLHGANSAKAPSCTSVWQSSQCTGMGL